jgi:predicted ATPase/predicted negative regulator of RcsB-dependent stress response
MEDETVGSSSPVLAPLSIRLFGLLEVFLEGKPFPPVRSNATLWLLALLALNYDHPCDRIWLAEALWPVGLASGRTQGQALANLRQRLAELRKKLGTQGRRLIEPAPGMLQLDLTGADVDLVAFDAALLRGDAASLEYASNLYRGYLLASLLSLDIPALHQAREWREKQYLKVLRRLAEQAMERGDVVAADRYLRLLDATPAAEPPQKPEPPPPPDNPWRLRSLPEPLTSLVGRTREIEEVKTCLRLRRLVTLLGIGGVGKTRLAVATAASIADRFADGVCLVDLARVHDPLAVTREVATALKVREQPNKRMLQTLQEALRDRSLLLVLDNCEHLLKACAEFADHLLQACAQMTFLTTSREALNVMGEQRYQVSPLVVPELSAERQAEGNLMALVARASAALLFIDRARLVRPDFALTAQNARRVAQICQELDGIPLAIELAAARMGAMDVEEISEHLQNRLGLLQPGNRAAPERHKTLRAMLDWSYNLLSEPERKLLRCVSVFVGGWSLAATAEVYCDEALDLLTSLVDKSLVQAKAHNGKTRYGMLETVREYAGKKLAESGEKPLVQGRHQDWCLVLAEAAETKLIGPEQDRWLQRLDSEHDNLRAALAFAGDCGTRMRIAGALRRYWVMRGQVSEGRQWLEACLAECDDASDYSIPTAPVRAKALQAAGALATSQGHYDVAQRFLHESLDLYRRFQDERGSAAALSSLGDVLITQGDFDAARSYYERSLDIWRLLDDRWCTAVTLFNLGTIAIRLADYNAARSSLEQSLVLYRDAGDSARVASVLDRLGALCWQQGDLHTARRYYEASLESLSVSGDQRIRARTLHNLGMAVYELEGEELSHPFLIEGLKIMYEQGDRNGLLFMFLFFVRIAMERRNFSDAVRLLAVSETLRTALGIEQEPGDQAVYEERVMLTRSELSDEAFQYHWVEGLRMSLEEAVKFATT